MLAWWLWRKLELEVGGWIGGWSRLGARERKESEMAGNKDAGQGKLPQVVVTDNALLKRKYEQDELEGKVPVMASTT